MAVGGASEVLLGGGDPSEGFQDLVGAAREAMCTAAPEIRGLTVALLLLVVTREADIDQSPFAEFLMHESIFDAALHIFRDREARAIHGCAPRPRAAP